MLVRALALAAAVGFSGPALAQQVRGATPGEGDGSVETRIGPPWDTVTATIVERRYKVEAVRFKARDETGIDWWGDDDVMVGTTDAKGFTSSAEIGSIDSGDTHNFDPAVSCIIGVLPGKVTLGESSVCDPAGEPGPFSFRVELW